MITPYDSSHYLSGRAHQAGLYWIYYWYFSLNYFNSRFDSSPAFPGAISGLSVQEQPGENIMINSRTMLPVKGGKPGA